MINYYPEYIRQIKEKKNKPQKTISFNLNTEELKEKRENMCEEEVEEVKLTENVNQFLYTASKGKYGFKRKKKSKL